MIIFEGPWVWCACASTEERSGYCFTSDLGTCSVREEEEVRAIWWECCWCSCGCCKGTSLYGQPCKSHTRLSVCTCPPASWVPTQPELQRKGAANRQERRNSLGLEVPWVQFPLPGTHITFPQTGSLKLIPFHGSTAVQAPAAQKSNVFQLFCGFVWRKLGFGFLCIPRKQCMGRSISLRVSVRPWEWWSHYLTCSVTEAHASYIVLLLLHITWSEAQGFPPPQAYGTCLSLKWSHVWKIKSFQEKRSMRHFLAVLHFGEGKWTGKEWECCRDGK